MLTHQPVVCAALVFILAILTAPAAAGHNAEPVVIFSRAWFTSSGHVNPPPAWLVVPALLDFQPVVLQVDVRRDAKAQLRRFCHSHSVDIAKCAVLHDALHEIVDLQRLCSQQQKRLESPSFMIVKNLILPTSAAEDRNGQLQPAEPVPSFAWVQDEAENIAVDLCRFAQSSSDGSGGSLDSSVDMRCVAALEATLLRSLDWINSLEPCDYIANQNTKPAEVSSPSQNQLESSTVNLKDRISTVEHLIAELTASPLKAIEDDETQREAVEKDIDKVIHGEQTGESAVARNDADAKLPDATQILDDKNANEEEPLTPEHADGESLSHQDVSSQSALQDQVREGDSVVQGHVGGLGDESLQVEVELTEDIPDAGSSTSEPAPPVSEPGTSETLEMEGVSAHHLSQKGRIEVAGERWRENGHTGHHELRVANDDDVMALTGSDDLNAPEMIISDHEEMLAVTAELKMVADDGERQMGNETPELGGTDDGTELHPSDESASLPTVCNLPAISNCSSNILTENSSATAKETTEASFMQTPTAPVAIEMPEAGEVLPAVEVPSPELLRVLSTLAVLFFVFYLAIDALAIRYLMNLEMLRECGNKVVQTLLSLSSFFIRSESKSTLRVNTVESLPIKEDSITKQQPDEPQKESLARQPSLSLAQVPSPRSWATVFFSSSGGKRSFEGEKSFQRRIQAVDTMVKAYIRRIQRTAFGMWRLGSMMQIGQSVTSSLARRQEATEDTSAANASGNTTVELVERRSQRPSFTYVAMALMFAKHGSHHFHAAINHAAGSTNGSESDERVKPRLSKAISKLLDDRSEFEDKSSPDHCAAQQIQHAWRLKHKKPVAARLSITSSSSSSSSSSVPEKPRSAVSTPSTPLFALLNKDLRKRSVSNAQVNSTRPAFPVRRVMTPASSMHLPPCS